MNVDAWEGLIKLVQEELTEALGNLKEAARSGHTDIPATEEQTLFENVLPQEQAGSIEGATRREIQLRQELNEMRRRFQALLRGLAILREDFCYNSTTGNTAKSRVVWFESSFIPLLVYKVANWQCVLFVFYNVSSEAPFFCTY